MERDDVGRGEQLLHRVGLLDAEVPEAIDADERVVRDDRHPEPERAAGDLLADPPEADHAERLPGDLDPAPPGALPPTVLESGVGLRDVPREREDQPDRLLRRRDDRRLRRVRDDDPASRRGGDVDVVDPDARAADHLQPVGALDHALREPRRRPDHDPVVAVDDLLERRVGVDVDVETAPQELDACLGDRLADENAVAHGRRPQAGAAVPNASSAAGAALPWLDVCARRRELDLDGRQRARYLLDRHVADVSDPEEPRHELAVTARDRDPVPVTQRKAKRDGVDPVRRERAGQHRGAVVVGRVQLEAHRLDPCAAGAAERAMAGERRLEPVGEHEPERLRERDDGRRRGRERGRELLLTLPLPLPVPVEPRQRRRAGSLPGAVGDRGEGEAGRRHQRLLRAGHDDVGAPRIGLERHGTEARDCVDDRDGPGLRADGEQGLEVADDAGGRLGVDEEHGAGATLVERRAEILRLRGLAPGVRERDDIAPERARHRLPALAELALRDGEDALARREQVHDRGLERTGPRGGEDEHLALRPEHRAKPLLGEREHLGEVRRAVMEHRPRERAQHLGRHRGRARASGAAAGEEPRRERTAAPAHSDAQPPDAQPPPGALPCP